MITVELIGSYIAVHLESGITADLTSRRNRSTTKSAIPVLARMLIEAGYDPQERLHVICKSIVGDRYIPVFKRDRTLIIWSGVDIIEDVAKGPREVKHRPYCGPATVTAKSKQESAEATATAAVVLKLINPANGNQENDALAVGEAR